MIVSVFRQDSTDTEVKFLGFASSVKSIDDVEGGDAPGRIYVHPKCRDKTKQQELLTMGELLRAQRLSLA